MLQAHRVAYSWLLALSTKSLHMCSITLATARAAACRVLSLKPQSSASLQYKWSNNGMFSKRDRNRIKRKGGLRSGFAYVQFADSAAVQVRAWMRCYQPVYFAPLW